MQNHLKKTLGDDFSVQLLTTSDLQAHVERRAKAKGRGGKPLSPTTIKKEIASFSGIWSWAVRMGHVTGAFPNKGLVYPKTSEKPPFQTRAEIEEQLERGGLKEDEKRELWSSLFLTLSEVAECLEHVRQVARHDSIYPMFCFAAHTGARRSEILRSRISDFDFQAKSVLIREKKRVKGRRTTRRVPLSSFLASVMREWFDTHPGGVYSISQKLKIFRSKKNPPGLRAGHHRREQLPLQRDDLGQQVGGDPRLALLPAFLRLELRARGVDQRLINAWLGHQTEEMARRYAHLIPNVAKTALDSVFE